MKVVWLISLIAGILVFVTSVSFLSVQQSFAHDPSVSLTGSGTATIDGVLSVGEWDNAGFVDFNANAPGGGTTPARIFVMDDGQNLYIAIRVQRASLDGFNGVNVSFDNDHGGETSLEIGDDRIELFNGSFRDFHFTGTTSILDTFAGGTTDGSGAQGNDGTFTVYEFSHPLDSADDANDFSLAPRTTVGANFVVGFGATLATSTITFFPSSSSTNPSLFGDIVISGGVPPFISSISDSPDPFAPNNDGLKDTTTIGFTSDEAGNYSIEIKDSGGTTVRTLTGTMISGSNNVVWDGRGEWIEQFGTSGSDTVGGVSADSSGVYVAGETSGAPIDVFVRKYETSGNLGWTDQFRIQSFNFAHGVSVDSSGVYVAGLLSSAESSDAFVRKYDTSGNVIWTEVFGAVGVPSPIGIILGGAKAFGVFADSSGVYVAGRTFGGTFQGQTNAGGADAFVRKYDFNGIEQWTRQFGTSGTDIANGVSVDSSGVYVAGNTDGAFPSFTNAGGEDVFVRKYDTSGNVIWTQQFGTSGNDAANGISVDFGIYVAGNTDGAFPSFTNAGGEDVFVRKYDTSGNVLRTEQFGTSDNDIARGVSVDASDVYVAGQTGGTLPGQTNAGGDDAYVRKYDFNLIEQWTRQFGTSGNDDANGVSVGSDVYVAGQTAGALPGQTSAGGFDAYVRKYTSNGDVPPGSFKPDDTYTYFITATDADDDTRAPPSGGDGTVTVFITTDATPPGAPNLLSPSDGAVISDTNTPTFDWSDVIDLTGVKYTVQIIKGFDIVIDQSGLTTSSFTATPLADDSYSWRARAVDGNENIGPFTSTFGFTIALDTDADGVVDASDNCPNTANADQLDTDGDGAGDACDTDDDNDGILDEVDTQPLVDSTGFSDVGIDGTTSGNIISKGDRVWLITNEPGNGIRIEVSAGTFASFEGTGACTITTDSTITSNSVIVSPTGGTFILSCLSMTVQVVDGSGEVIVTIDTITISIPLEAGEEVTLDTRGDGSFIVKNPNDDPLVITVDGETVTIGPGKTAKVTLTTDTEKGQKAEDKQQDKGQNKKQDKKES